MIDEQIDQIRQKANKYNESKLQLLQAALKFRIFYKSFSVYSIQSL